MGMTPSNFRNFFRRNSDREGRQQAGQQQDAQQQAGEEQVGQPRQRRNSQDGSEDDPGRAARATASPEQPTAARHSPRHSPRAQRQRAMARRQPSRQNGPPAQGTGEHTPPLVAVPQGTRPGAQRQMVTHIVEISAEGANNSVFNRRTPRNVQVRILCACTQLLQLDTVSMSHLK